MLNYKIIPNISSANGSNPLRMLSGMYEQGIYLTHLSAVPLKHREFRVQMKRRSASGTLNDMSSDPEIRRKHS